jgi:hypothetical protein
MNGNLGLTKNSSQGVFDRGRDLFFGPACRRYLIGDLVVAIQETFGRQPAAPIEFETADNVHIQNVAALDQIRIDRDQFFLREQEIRAHENECERKS